MSLSVALVADTHGLLDPRIAEVVAGCDLCVHAGDVGNSAVLDALRPRQHLYAVLGNNDTPRQWPSRDHRRLAELPASIQLDLPGGQLVAIHGDRVNPARRRHEKLRRRFPDALAVVYGHSHRFVIDQTERPWILNPGAAGRDRTYGGPSCLVLTITGEVWSLEPFRFPVRRY